MPYNSSYIYSLKARIVKFVDDDDHYWFETSAYFRKAGSDTSMFEKSVGAVSLSGAEKALLQYIHDFQDALLQDMELVPNPFY